MRALPRRVVVPVALLGAAATLVVTGVPWAQGTVPTVLSSDEITVAGTSAAPAVPALALVGLAAAAALAIGRRWAVVVASVGLLVAGIAITALSIGVILQPEPAVLEAAGRVSGVRRLEGPAGATAAPYLAALLGVLVALAGVAGLLGGREWGRTGRRFERAVAVPGPAGQVAGSTGQVPGSTGHVPGSTGQVPGSGDRVFGSGDRVFGSGDRVPGSGDRVPGSADQRPAPGEASGSTATGPAVSERDRAMDDWDALGRGEDPSDPGSRR